MKKKTYFLIIQCYLQKLPCNVIPVTLPSRLSKYNGLSILYRSLEFHEIACVAKNDYTLNYSMWGW